MKYRAKSIRTFRLSAVKSQAGHDIFLFLSLAITKGSRGFIALQTSKIAYHCCHAPIDEASSCAKKLNFDKFLLTQAKTGPPSIH